MSLLEAFDGVETAQSITGPRCTFARIKQDVSPEEYARLEEVLSNDRLSNALIARRLSAAGYKVAAGTVERHRNRAEGNGCRCPL